MKPLNTILALATFGMGLLRFLEWSAMDGASSGAICSPVIVSLIILAMHLVFWGIATRTLQIKKRHNWLVVAGAMTYPLYLIHDRIGLTAMLALEPSMNKWWQLITVSIGACTFAFAIWRWWEAPLSKALQRLGKRWTNREEHALTLEQKT